MLIGSVLNRQKNTVNAVLVIVCNALGVFRDENPIFSNSSLRRYSIDVVECKF